MKTKEELKELSNAIGKAIYAFHQAVFDNLKEIGRELKVLGDDDYEDEKSGLRLSIVGRHDDLVDIVVDKIRYNKESDSVEVHVCEEDYKDTDVWYGMYILGDDVDYVNDAIDWDS